MDALKLKPLLDELAEEGGYGDLRLEVCRPTSWHRRNSAAVVGQRPGDRGCGWEKPKLGSLPRHSLMECLWSGLNEHCLP